MSKTTQVRQLKATPKPERHLRLVNNTPMQPTDMTKRQMRAMVFCALIVVILLVWWGSSPSESDTAPVVRDTIVSPVTAPG